VASFRSHQIRSSPPPTMQSPKYERLRRSIIAMTTEDQFARFPAAPSGCQPRGVTDKLERASFIYFRGLPSVAAARPHI
jgi:hypothetical protein